MQNYAMTSFIRLPLIIQQLNSYSKLMRQQQLQTFRRSCGKTCYDKMQYSNFLLDTLVYFLGGLLSKNKFLENFRFVRLLDSINLKKKTHFSASEALICFLEPFQDTSAAKFSLSEQFQKFKVIFLSQDYRKQYNITKALKNSTTSNVFSFWSPSKVTILGFVYFEVDPLV